MNNIHIDEMDILNTIQVCSDELDQLENKYMMKQSTILSVFIKKEIIKYSVIALFGILLIAGLAICISSSLIGLASIYFLILGLFALYTQIKNKYYNMSELMSSVYFNEGKMFLIESVAISFIQCISLLCFILLEKIVFNESLSLLLLQAILPVYVSQIVVMACVNKTKNAFTNVMQFIIVYALCQCVRLHLMQMVIVDTLVYVFTFIVIVLFIIEFVSIYYLKKKKRGLMLWN